MGILTGCDEFCIKPDEAKPADMGLLPIWLKSRLASSSKFTKTNFEKEKK